MSVRLGAWALAIAHRAADLVLVSAEFYYSRRHYVELLGHLQRGQALSQEAPKGSCGCTRQLAQLPDEYVVFNDFHPHKSGKDEPEAGNIDHVVIGPTGVFVLEAKNYGRTYEARRHATSTPERTR